MFYFKHFNLRECFLQKYFKFQKNIAHLHIVFFGNDDFSLPHLKTMISIIESNVSVPSITKFEVITSSEKSLISEYCKSVKFPFLLWSKISDDRFINADLGVIASFGKMLPESLIGTFKKGIINVHPSLIPRWRGSSPIIYSLLNSDTTIGVTILETSPNKFDQGKILLQQKFEINPYEHTRASLTQYLSRFSSEMMCEVIGNIDLYKSQARAQPNTGVTIARKINESTTKISFLNQTSSQIDIIYRAAADIFPLSGYFDGLYVKLFDMISRDNIDSDVLSQLHNFSQKPGAVKFLRARDVYFYARARDDWVGFKFIKIGRTANKRKTLSANDFASGFLKEYKSDVVLFS